MIHAVELSKRYGRKRVIDRLSFEVDAGALLLVTGANGSGKTTLLRLCAGLAAPSEGSLTVHVDRSRLGYVAHDALVYRELTALENLDLYGRLYRLRERRERVGMVLERFGLWELRHERVSSYSRGMLQRLALARAFLHEPDVFILDEPYTALDAATRTLLDREFAERRGSATFVVATHDPAHLASLATSRLDLAA